MIKPLRDIIVAVLLDDVTKSGLLHIPVNYSEAMLQHGRALVLASGPIAVEQGCVPGVVIHVSEAWGQAITHNGKKYKMGRSRDINGILPGETVPDFNKYLD